MPTESHEDFSQVSGNKLVMLREITSSRVLANGENYRIDAGACEIVSRRSYYSQFVKSKAWAARAKKIDLETIRKIETIKKIS
jgi:hypothetical protein